MPPTSTGGFKIASAYVEVNLKDHTKTQIDQLKRSLERGRPIKLRASIDGKGLSGQIKKLAKSAAKNKVQLGLGLRGEKRFAGQVKRLAKTVSRGSAVDLGVKVNRARARQAGRQLAQQASKGAQQTGRSGGTLLATAIAAGVSLGAPAIGAALTTAVGAGFIGIAAVAQHNNELVVDSYQRLWRSVRSETKQATAGLVDDFVAAADDLGDTAAALRPQLDAAFTGVEPDVALLTSGVERLARNTMPGLVDAAGTSSAAMDGLSDFLARVGDTAGNMFTDLSQHSAQFGQDWRVLGSVIDSTVDLATHLITQLGDVMAEHGAQIDHVFASIDHTVTGLSSTALPALGNSAFGALGVVADLLDVIGPAAPALGELGAQALTAYAGFRLLSRAGSGMTTLGAKITNAAGESGGAVSRLGSGLSKAGRAAGALAPVLGVVLPIVLDKLTEGERRAADQAADLAQNTATLRQVMAQLGTTNGPRVVAALTDLAASQSTVIDGGQTLAANLRDVGINLTTVGYAALASTDRMQGLAAQGLSRLQRQFATGQISITQYFSASKDLAAQMYGLKKAAADAADLQDVLNRKQEEGTRTASHLKTPTQELVADLETLTGKANSAADAAKALDDALKHLSGGAESMADAQASFYETLDGLKEKLKDLKGPLTTSAGGFDLMSERSRGLRDSLKDVRQEWADYATSASAAGKSNKEVRRHLQHLADDLRDRLGKQLGLSRSDVDKLLGSLHALPGQIVTTYTNPGMAKAQIAAGVLKGKIDAIPDSKTIIAHGLTRGAIDKLETLGLKVKRLPDGTVKITGDDAKFMSTLRTALRKAGEKVAMPKTDADPAGFMARMKHLLNWGDSRITRPGVDAQDRGFLGTVDRMVAGGNRRTTSPGVDAHPRGFWDEVGSLLHGAARRTASMGIDAHDAGALAAAARIRAEIAGESVSIAIRGVIGSLPFAQGGIAIPHGAVIGNDGGNLLYEGHHVGRMPGGIAQMVPPNTPRLVGDAHVMESYIPVDHSSRSKHLLAETNDLMGDPLGVHRRRGTTAVTETRVINENHFHVTVRDNATAYEAARMVAAEQGWQARVRR